MKGVIKVSNIPTEDTIVKMDSVEEEEWIRAIKALLFRNSEEGLIPEVTVSDDGKVLTVVRGAWDKADAPSGSGEAGYECIETETVLFNETVTVAENNGMYVADLDYVMSEPVNELIITFDGTRYVCQSIDADGNIVFGGVDTDTDSTDFTNYPFVVIFSGDNRSTLITNTDGTHTVVASVSEIGVETTECFEKAACESAVCILTVSTKIEGTDRVLVLKKTWQEIYDIAKTKMVLLRTYENGYMNLDPLVKIGSEDSDYLVEFGVKVFTATSVDGYPTDAGEK